MIPKVAKHGHSFKGAAAYYLHDKAQDNDFNHAAGAKPTTQDRVSWTETRNLATDNPDTAWKVMAATSMDGDYLKRQNREAEGKRAQASGDSNAKSVYAFSLGWHPDEKATLTREEMTTAAEQALDRLGLSDHQAMFIAHDDTDHPHVHVLVNKTHPETGRVVNPHRDYNKLDQWAREYRQERGQEHYCQNREDKWKKHDEGQSNANREKQTGAKLDKGESATLNANTPEAAKLRKELAAEGNRLSEAAKMMKAEHGDQWARFKAKNKAEKSAIYDRYKTPMKDARERLQNAKATHADIKATYKAKADDAAQAVYDRYAPQRSALGKKQWKDKRAFEAHENSLTGRLSHAITAAIHNRKQSPAQSKGFVKDTARMFLNTTERRAAFDRMQKGQFDEIRKQVRQDQRAVRAEIMADAKNATAHTREAMAAAVEDMQTLHNHRTGELDSYKAAETSRYVDLKGNQQTDRQKLQEQWGALKAKRGASIRNLRNKLKQNAEKRHAHNQAFKEASKDEAKKEAETKTQNRNRSKERKPRNRGRTQRYER